MIGNNIKKFDVLDSTNDFAKRNIVNLPHGCIVVANTQTNGKGRRNKKWESGAGNLYFSLVLKEDISRKNIFKYTVFTSLAITKTLEMFSINSDIKYPNDCLVNNKKIAGILIESLGSTELEYLIIGIGLNVNQNIFEILSEKATSMKIETNKLYDLNKLLDSFVFHFNSLLNGDLELIFREYINKSVVIGKNIQFEGADYKIKTIDIKGALIIINDKQELKIAFNEISLEELY